MKSPALMTDLYQLTMLQTYWRAQKQSTEASFYLHFRENPFSGGYAIACGLAQVAEYIEEFAFSNEDIAYLAAVSLNGVTPLFDPAFVQELSGLRLTIDIDAVREGEVVFPHEPILRVTGSLMQCQIIETALLNIIGFQTIVATKAARICSAAKGPVAEFGLRRAQGPAGGIFASRAAIVGGCSSTSNIEAGKVFDLPISGTHAHSMVMAFESELAAFRAYAETFPQNCTLLVDTYDVLSGVANAIIVAHEMEQRGERLAGIRIDSGDLAWLSRRARTLLDEAGLSYVKIVASNNLDEYTISSLINEQGACIDAWGVGTRLATAFDQPALGCVYKMAAVRDSAEDPWRLCLKISEQAKKTTLPGLLAVRRYLDSKGTMIGDMVYDLTMPPAEDHIIDPADELRQKDLSSATPRELLTPFIRGGTVVSLPSSSALEAQAYTRQSLAQLDVSNKRLLNSHSYPVGLERSLFALRGHLVRESRGL